MSTAHHSGIPPNRINTKPSFTPLKGLPATLKPGRGDAILPGLFNSDTAILKMSSLTEKQKHHLRGLGHKLKPVVMIGAQGYTPAVRTELDLALTRHELLKVRVNSGDRDRRDETVMQLCSDCGAQLVQRIGNIALLYRRNPDKPRITLP